MDADIIACQLAHAPGGDAVRAIGGSFADATPELIAQTLRSASHFTDQFLVPVNIEGDRKGCRLEDGRVITPNGHRAAWDELREGGWLMLDASPEMGGMGLPTALGAAVQEIMDQACPAFGMMPVSVRAGARLLKSYADAAMSEEWLPRLMAGEWGTTICISEPDAGSDVARIRTRATQSMDGSWSVTGEKCWISYGDHDLTTRIGHLLLAKTAMPDGDDAISLFLVPDRYGEDRNGVFVRRIEEKLGLHLSPTCVLEFEGARATLLGEQGRGLPQLFVMITHMRLATGAMGAGIAGRAYRSAFGYAHERRQGGRGPTATPIAEHTDVQRMLLGMAVRLETLRGLIYATANHLDLAQHHPDSENRVRSAALSGWLLPIVKTLGGHVAFDVSSEAIQVFGGAGYTKLWPVEQCLRDARVLTIFEGTTGMQAQDLLRRRLLKGDALGYRTFLTEARSTATECSGKAGAALTLCLDQLEETATTLCDGTRSERDIDAGATAFLSLATAAATSWIAARLSMISDEDDASAHLAAAGRFALSQAAAYSIFHATLALSGAENISDFGELH